LLERDRRQRRANALYLREFIDRYRCGFDDSAEFRRAGHAIPHSPRLTATSAAQQMTTTSQSPTSSEFQLRMIRLQSFRQRAELVGEDHGHGAGLPKPSGQSLRGRLTLCVVRNRGALQSGQCDPPKRASFSGHVWRTLQTGQRPWVR
jgi:hypothetical protein